MIRLSGLDALNRERLRLRKVRRRLSDFSTLHRRTGAALLGWVGRNFEAWGALLEEAPSGWPPLARATLASRARRGRGSAPLQDSGRLRAGFVLTVGMGSAVLDNPVPYAPLHQLGQGVPRRPIFPGARQARAIVLPETLRHVEEALR